MWNPDPYIDALWRTAHSSLAEDEARARQHIMDIVMRQGERRPLFMHEGASEIESRPMGFVYDRASGLIFMGGWADHERTAGCLMLFRELRGPVDWDRADDAGEMHNGRASDRFLEGGHGFIANSPALTQGSGSWPLNLGKDVTLTAQERQWFRTLILRRA